MCEFDPYQAVFTLPEQRNGSAENYSTTTTEATYASIDNASYAEFLRYYNLYEFHVKYQPIHGPLCFAICLAGIAVNTVYIRILTRPQMVSIVNILLCGIAIAETLLMVSNLIHIGHFRLIHSECISDLMSYYWIMFLRFHSNFTITIHSIALWLTVAVGIVRCLVLERKIYFAPYSLPGFGSRAREIRLGVAIVAAVALVICAVNVPMYISQSIYEDSVSTVLMSLDDEASDRLDAATDSNAVSSGNGTAGLTNFDLFYAEYLAEYSKTTETGNASTSENQQRSPYHDLWDSQGSPANDQSDLGASSDHWPVKGLSKRSACGTTIYRLFPSAFARSTNCVTIRMSYWINGIVHKLGPIVIVCCCTVHLFKFFRKRSVIRRTVLNRAGRTTGDPQRNMNNEVAPNATSNNVCSEVNNEVLEDDQTTLLPKVLNGQTPLDQGDFTNSQLKTSSIMRQRAATMPSQHSARRSVIFHKNTRINGVSPTSPSTTVSALITDESGSNMPDEMLKTPTNMNAETPVDSTKTPQYSAVKCAMKQKTRRSKSNDSSSYDLPASPSYLYNDRSPSNVPTKEGIPGDRYRIQITDTTAVGETNNRPTVIETQRRDFKNIHTSLTTLSETLANGMALGRNSLTTSRSLKVPQVTHRSPSTRIKKSASDKLCSSVDMSLSASFLRQLKAGIDDERARKNSKNANTDNNNGDMDIKIKNNDNNDSTRASSPMTSDIDNEKSITKNVEGKKRCSWGPSSYESENESVVVRPVPRRGVSVEAGMLPFRSRFVPIRFMTRKWQSMASRTSGSTVCTGVTVGTSVGSIGPSTGQSSPNILLSPPTAALIAIIVCLVCLETPNASISIASAVSPVWAEHVYNNLGDVFDMFALLNSLISFSIYCSMSADFRANLRHTLCCRGDVAAARRNPRHSHPSRVSKVRHVGSARRDGGGWMPVWLGKWRSSLDKYIANRKCSDVKRSCYESVAYESTLNVSQVNITCSGVMSANRQSVSTDACNDTEMQIQGRKISDEPLNPTPTEVSRYLSHHILAAEVSNGVSRNSTTKSSCTLVNHFTDESDTSAEGARTVSNLRTLSMGLPESHIGPDRTTSRRIRPSNLTTELVSKSTSADHLIEFRPRRANRVASSVSNPKGSANNRNARVSQSRSSEISNHCYSKPHVTRFDETSFDEADDFL